MNSQLWTSDSNWVSRIGTVWTGLEATATIIDNPRPRYPTEIKWANLLVSDGHYSRKMTSTLKPGMYQIRPWIGCADEYIREVEIKPGQTTTVRIELE